MKRLTRRARGQANAGRGSRSCGSSNTTWPASKTPRGVRRSRCRPACNTRCRHCQSTESQAPTCSGSMLVQHRHLLHALQSDWQNLDVAFFVCYRVRSSCGVGWTRSTLPTLLGSRRPTLPSSPTLLSKCLQSRRRPLQRRRALACADELPVLPSLRIKSCTCSTPCPLVLEGCMHMASCCSACGRHSSHCIR